MIRYKPTKLSKMSSIPESMQSVKLQWTAALTIDTQEDKSRMRKKKEMVNSKSVDAAAIAFSEVHKLT